MEFNKDGLILLAKKLTNQNYSLPKNFTLKTNNIPSKSFLYNYYIKDMNNTSTKDFIINESQDNTDPPSKKGIKFKNKFLEKENIKINEEKMMNILSERKRKLKLALSQNNNRIKKIIGKSKIIYINLDNSENNIITNTNTQFNSCRDSKYKNPKIIKYNTKFDKYNDNDNDNDYDNVYSYFKDDIKRDTERVLYNSNSEFFNNNSLFKNYISERKSVNIKEKKNIIDVTDSYTKDIFSNSYYKKFSHSRNDEYNNNNLNNSINKFYSNKKKDNNIINEKNEDIDNDIKNKENHINNNININININNNINNNSNLNQIKKIDNKKLKKFKKSFNRYFKPKKYVSYRQKEGTSPNELINDADYHSLIKEDEIKENNNNKNNNKSEKKIKKYVSHKIFYINDINNNNENNENMEDIQDNNKNVNKYKDEEIYEKEKTYEDLERNTLNYMDYNTYNINVNFISDEKNNFSNFYSNNKNINNINNSNINNGVIISKKTKPILSKPKDIIDNKNSTYFESLGNNNKIYSSQIINRKNINNIDDKNVNDNKMKPYSKLGQKFYKNKVLRNTLNNSNLNNSQNKYKSNNPNETNNNNIINNKKDIIQLEDLLILEGKFCHLLECLNLENPIPKMCVEWWNFYNYSSYFGKFPNLFPKTNKDKNNNKYFVSDYQIAHDSILLELLSMIIIYKILCIPQINQNIINNLKNLMNEMHQNFLIECDYILSNVSSQSMKNIWIKKLKNLIVSKRNWENNSKIYNYHLYLLKEGNKRIQNIIQYLINYYSKAIPNNENDNDSLIFYNKNISDMNLIELSSYFNKTISQENIKTNKAFSYIIKKKFNNDNKYISIVVPYLPEEIEDKKNYTLVLDLDETLISFRIDENLQTILRMRPGLFTFLKNVKKKYEIIAFTAGTQQYAEPILDKIEKNEKFFAKRLYRQHTILKNNIYIKDLTRLGRDLSKIIIVDNMPQNFSLQKENGILIKNFFGQEKYETTLNDLSNILLKIASNPNNDVRKELKKFREEIFTKITTNLKC